MNYTVDRIEENKVVCESSDRKMEVFDKPLFPDVIKEGDAVQRQCDGSFIIVDNSGRKKRIKKLMDSLWK